MAGDLVDAPFTDLLQVWAADIYRGDSPLSLSPTSVNPILTHSDVLDPTAIGVADPWLFTEEDEWFLFVEVIKRVWGAPNNQHGVIGLATSLDQGRSWRYEGVVLEEPWHLSYPQIFQYQESFYMVPESHNAGNVTLYRAEDFPHGWSAETVLLTGDYVDPTVFAHSGRWWLFVNEERGAAADTLRLFSADDLSGPYEEHPASPVVTGDISKARSAGPVISFSELLVRFAQDGRGGYGRAVRAFSITKLTTTEYAEIEVGPSPVLAGSGSGWNADGMHHVAPVQIGDHEWVAAVDGYFEKRVFGLDY